MSSLLALADDFIDRMTNPAHGLAINDEYAMKFARLLQDEQFEAELNRQIAAVDHVDALSSHAWLWAINWARSQRVVIREEVLVELFDRWGDVAAKASIVALVLDRFDDVRFPGDQRLEEFPVPFLARVMRRAVETPQPLPRQDRDGEPLEFPGEPEESQASMARAEALLVALLQVGSAPALAAAAVFLRHRWRGHDELGQFFGGLLERLEPETRAAWERSIFGRFA